MEQDRREQERANLLAAIASLAEVMDELDERIAALAGRSTTHPTLASLLKVEEKEFAADVVAAMKSLRRHV
jgi:hypothetical protein